MASVKQSLTRGWIQFLKNNQIAALQSNPKTGKINYNREPTVTDLMNYLRKDYDEDDILNAVEQVKGKESSEGDPESAGGELATQGSRDPSTWHQNEITPGQRQEPNSRLGNNPTAQSKSKKYNTDDAEDAKYSQRGVVPYKQQNTPSTWHNSEVTPAEPQDQIGNDPTRKQRPKRFNTDDAEDAEVKDRKSIGGPRALNGPNRKLGRLKEAIRDRQGDNLSEKEIQAIFAILAQPRKSEVSKDIGADASAGSGQTGDAPASMEEQIRQIKRVIRDSMTDQQRKALYRALTDD